jgi:uncharacterized protein (UPF0335 family)
MSDENIELGGNAARDFNQRLEAYSEALDDVKEAKDRADEIKKAAKDEGYDMKAFANVEKLRRKGAAHLAGQLKLELIRNTYLKAAGMPSTYEEAQKAADAEAAAAPEPNSEKKAKNKRRGMN